MKKLSALTILICLAFPANAQDIHFSQFNFSPLTLNPALAGAQYDMQVNLNYKHQWQSVATPFRTSAASFDMRLNKARASKGYFGIGMNFFNDQAGDGKMMTTQGSATAAYHVKLNNYNTFGAAIQAGYAQRSLNGANLQWGSQFDGFSYDPTLPVSEAGAGSASFGYFDLGAGINWNHDNTSGSKSVTNNHDEKINLGIGVFHLTRPNYAFFGEEKLYFRIVAHGSAILSVPNSNVAFVPGFMYARQGPAGEIYAGTLIRYVIGMDSKYTGFRQGAAFSFGGYFRANDALAVVTLLEFSNYAIGLSYDVNISKLKTSSTARGGIEIALRFVSPNPFKPHSSGGRLID
jgi:type IX secretion system PorP/SprF family membrane protein